MEQAETLKPNEKITINQSVFERHLKKTVLVSNLLGIIVACLTAFAVGFGFYYKTIYTQEAHTESIQELQKDVVELTESQVLNSYSNGMSKVELDNLKDRIFRIESTSDRIEDKIDKMIINGH